MGLCPSKAQQDTSLGAHGKIADHDGAAAPVGSGAMHKQAGISSAGPDQRPASTDSGQPAAAADGISDLRHAGARTQVEAASSAEDSSTLTAQRQQQFPVGSPTAALAGAAHVQTAQQPAVVCKPQAKTSTVDSMPVTVPVPTLVNGTGAAGAAAVCAAAASAAGAPPVSTPAVPQAQAPQQVMPQLPQQQEQQQQPLSSDLMTKQWDRAACIQPSALANAAGSRLPSHGGRSVKFADPGPESSEEGSTCGDDSSLRLSGSGGSAAGSSVPKAGGRRSLPRRSISSSALRSSAPGNEVSEAVLAKQAEILRSNKAGKLRLRRGGLDSSFAALQGALTQDGEPIEHVATRAAGLKHIGFGPFKRENQDEFFIQVGDFGGITGGNLFCVFDGHGTHGKDAALYSRQLLPRLLDVELRKYFMRVGQDSEAALRGAVEVLITEVFGDTERSLTKSGVNLASSGTTASVAFQRGNRLWVAAAGDSRAILCTRNARDQWRALPLTIDHRPRRTSERERIEAAGARVAPKRLPSGRSVGEPRLWLQGAGGPGLLLSRSLGDLTAATVGCTSDPEVTFTTLRPQVDQVLVMATDGVWDVLTNEQVCDIVVESPDPHIACKRVLDAALYEWEERMSADNITVLVVEFEWNEDGLVPVAMDHASAPAPVVRADGTFMPQQMQQVAFPQ